MSAMGSKTAGQQRAPFRPFDAPFGNPKSGHRPTPATSLQAAELSRPRSSGAGRVHAGITPVAGSERSSSGSGKPQFQTAERVNYPVGLHLRHQRQLDLRPQDSQRGGSQAPCVGGQAEVFVLQGFGNNLENETVNLGFNLQKPPSDVTEIPVVIRPSGLRRPRSSRID